MIRESTESTLQSCCILDETYPNSITLVQVDLTLVIVLESAALEGDFRGIFHMTLFDIYIESTLQTVGSF